MTTTFDSTWQNVVNNHASNDFEIVEHGWEQHVMIDHKNQVVYRYPRTKSALKKLFDEKSILEELNKIDFNVAIPHIIEQTDEYTAYRYIPGEVLSDQILSSLSSKNLVDIGNDLGVFLAQFHKINPSVLLNKPKPKQSLMQYYKERINLAKHTGFYRMAIEDLSVVEVSVEKVVVHGDLHGLNIVINPKTKMLCGIIDFSELELGDRHQDFRKIFMTDERLLKSSIESYKTITGISLDPKIIKAWAYVNEWANLAYFYEQPNHPTFIRAKKHLAHLGKLA